MSCTVLNLVNPASLSCTTVHDDLWVQECACRQRALRGCVVPGCGRRRRLHVHHIVHDEDGGTTVPANLCCLCPAHHRLHHAGRLGIAGDPTKPDGLRFTDQSGRLIRGPSPESPAAPPARGGRRHGPAGAVVGAAARRAPRHEVDHLELSVTFALIGKVERPGTPRRWSDDDDGEIGRASCRERV